MKRAPRLRVDVVTLFPGMLEGCLGLSMLKRAAQKGLLEVACVDPRDFTRDRRRTVDERPYGGGPGMVLMAEPLYKAIRSVRRRGSKVILLSPQGRPFIQAEALKLSRLRHLILVCGHYEGVDARLLGHVDMELSLGDFVLTGGEIPALAVIDAVSRLLPGALPPGAAEQDSFREGRLEHPHYTRPRVWRGRRVPRALLSGDHARIARWRARAALEATRVKRPDLVDAKLGNC